MKSKFLAATAFAAIITGMSCGLFSSKKTNNETQNAFLSGRYELLGITDSSSHTKFRPADTLKWFSNSPAQRYLNFSRDSLVTYETSTQIDSGRYYTDTANKTVYIKEDSTYRPFSILPQPDSIINLLAASDSIYIALKKL